MQRSGHWRSLRHVVVETAHALTAVVLACLAERLS